MDDLLTIKEVAQRLKMNERTIKNWLRSGRLKGLKAGRKWRVRASDLESFLERSAGHTDPLEAVNEALEGTDTP
jgi:excisionase family DNA binding protein